MRALSKILFSLLFAYLSVLLLVVGWEYYMLGIIEQPKMIEEYRFGSEAMVSNGGMKYKTHQAYVAHSLKFVLITLTSILAGLSVLKFAKKNSVWKANAIFVLSILVLFMSG
ncbi:hypothetical protein [Pseudoalteromonas sp. A757]|uniref:hypothetical protein n=1 Tax=Pseudoalteromonas sp. A757 TaxID=2250709 RepID=UPI0010271113|nr:hypothetical protein [Pseudoalteromonas sp. A757]NKC19721.1 hypothetical protein [Pseudoalteromonas galatheae]RXE86875.1 hypothetical protein DRB05_09780 [Pseudoalteromonas sp. A757]